MTTPFSKLHVLSGQWGKLTVVVGDRIVEIWGKMIRQGKGVLIQYMKLIKDKPKIIRDNHHNRNVVSWQPHFDK